MNEKSILERFATRSDIIKNKQKLTDLAQSFKSSLKSLDLHKAAKIAKKMRPFTDNNEDRKLLIEIGIVPYIISAMSPEYDHNEPLLVECSWILCNIASKDSQDVQYLIGLGTVEKNLELIRHHNYEVQENIIWFLANIAGDSIAYRDMLLDQGIVSQIEWLLQSIVPINSFTYNISWLIANLTRGRPYPAFEKVSVLAKYLGYLLKNTEHIDTLTRILWSLSYLTDGDDEQLQEISKLDIWSHIIQLARTKDNRILAPAIRLISNMLSGPYDQVELLVQSGVIELYAELLEHPSKIVRKEIYFGLSNLLANDDRTIQKIFDFQEEKIIQTLLKTEKLTADEERERFFCINNLCCYSNITQLSRLIEFDVIDLCYSTLAQCSDEKLITLCLGSLQGILTRFENAHENEQLNKDDVISIIKSCGLRLLENHPNATGTIEKLYRLLRI